MNCEKAEQLIPLYVESDLDAAELQQVSEHLDICLGCRNLATEFHASQSLLHSAAFPKFDEALFTDMRTAVQHTVARTATRPSFAELLNLIWNWKFAFATAAALLLLVSGIVLNLRIKTGSRNGVASNGQQKVRATNSVAAVPNVAVAENLRLPAFPQPRSGRKNKAQSGMSISERNLGNANTKHASPTRTIDIDPQLSAAAIAPAGATDSSASIPRVGTLGFILPPAAQAEDDLLAPEQKSSTNSATSSESEMLRMEIQTADPNIKIIWLTPKDAISSQRNPAAESK